MAAPAAQPLDGIVWPITDQSSGDRSSTKTSQEVWADSFRVMDKDAADQALAEKNWRYKYHKYIIKHVQLSLATPKNALDAARAGLDSLHRHFEFVRDGKTYSFAEALQKFQSHKFEMGVIKGEKPKPSNAQYEVPYGKKTLRGQELLEQLKRWAKYGTIEPDTAEAISKVASNGQWVDLSDQYFVLLGAGAAMGPYPILMSLGANVIALDIDIPRVWERLISIAKNSSGTLYFPMKKKQESLPADQVAANAGCNLMSQTPEIVAWLNSVFPDKRLIVGTYVYLDGERHVRVALACDAIVASLCKRALKPMLVYLCTPTDVHVIPDDARKAALSNYNSMNWRNLAVLPIRTFLGHRYLVRNAAPKITAKDNTEFSIVDGIVVAQGPNYALAKRMQHWRAVVARAEGCAVSSHIAPSTSTASVTSNRQFAWAYDGMPFFRPYEIPVQDTSNAVMAALLIHDLRNNATPAYPSYPLRNPLELFSHYGFHGGLWRCAYTINSIGEVSALIHFVKVGRPYLLVLLALAVAFFVMRFTSRL